MDELRPKKPKNNEFVESGLEKWVLVNQTNSGTDLDDKSMKRKKGCVENIVIGKVRGGLFFYITHESDYKFDSGIYFVSPFLFPFFSIPQSRFFFFLLYSPSALSISPHVVAVKLKHTFQASHLH